MSLLHRKSLITLGYALLCSSLTADPPVPVYNIFELELRGSPYSSTDNPVKDILLTTRWQHRESGEARTVYGFYDGDGRGNPSGDLFKVRFCPDKTGRWTLTEVASNDPRLKGQSEGLRIDCHDSGHPGFWIVDTSHAGGRWYQRADGSHPYIVGNTFYGFLSEYRAGKPSGGTIRNDVEASSRYFKKLRFSLTGDMNPNPVEKPFLDPEGRPTDDGFFSHRPNPKWFSERVDLAVQTAFVEDVIADMILNGPDTPESRRILSGSGNAGDAEPFLRYIAARYASYPNLWICLSNEFNIRKPHYESAYIIEMGRILQKYLPNPTPVSVHSDQGNWLPELNADPGWNDHVIFQNKLKNLNTSADYTILNYWIGGRKPVINDELAYEGAGDGWSEEDVIEAILGAFMGGGYASTAYKSGSKEGHYFTGNFKATEHTSADNLSWMGRMIEENISFWKMVPAYFTDATYGQHYEGTRSSRFFDLSPQFRVLEWPDKEYVLAANHARTGMFARLPEGQWTVVAYDCISMERTLLSDSAEGDFSFSSPDSRAFFVHFSRNANDPHEDQMD